MEQARSFVAWVDTRGGSDSAASNPARADRVHRLRNGNTQVEWTPRAAASAPPQAESERARVLVLGDDSEFDVSAPERNLASGVPLTIDAATGSIVLYTSIVGLPPVLRYRDAHVVAVASDVHMLLRIPGLRLELDPRAVVELARIGHPIAHRTLFRGLDLLPSGARVRMRGTGEIDIEETWRLPTPEPLDWQQFIEAQIAAFGAAVDRLDLSRSFLSLTAGLDTRTVFATLADGGRLVPTATMTGPKRSLDARAAARLSSAYGIDHHAVTFDERYARALPDLVTRANLLSGGLASLDQAPEVWFYEQLGGAFGARLSGNLGNQVGRGGTEGVSTRGAEERILAPDRRAATSDDGGHWLLGNLDQSEQARLEFILKNEIAFTLANNYPVGNHFAAQQTPYANRALIETLSRRPAAGTSMPSGSLIRMRLRDLAHRFLGEPEERSFQRTLLRRANGFAARYPINWGWRASGGISPAGAALGFATLLGMYARARGLDGGMLRRPLSWSGLPALHDFRESRRWLREDLQEFTREILSAESTRVLFDRAALGTVLDEHFSGRRDHYQTVTFALDIALAYRNFCTHSTGMTA